MRAIKQLIGIFVLLLILSACATTPAKMPDKYNLDGQLERVTEILRYNMMGWDAVDMQSFVLQTTPSDYYLIVLASPSDRLVFAEVVGINATGDVVKPGYNTVFVKGTTSEETYIINKIYKFKDFEQVKAIKEQITGKKK
jgi:hypothetical protein